MDKKSFFSSLWEKWHVQEELDKLKGMTFKKKLEYFWDYYKVPVGLILLFGWIIISILHTAITSRDAGYYVTLINTAPEVYQEDLLEAWSAELEERIGMDTKKYRTVIEMDLRFLDHPTSQMDTTASAKLMTLSAARELDSVIANTSAFEHFAQLGYFTDLRDLYTQEELASYNAGIYYTDRATMETTLDSDRTITLDHTSPEGMTDPIPVGFILSENTKVYTSGYYYDIDTLYEPFQGEPQYIVYGITACSKRPEAAKIAFEFFAEK